MQIDMVQELSPSGGYEDIVIAMVVHSRYKFAYPTSSQGVKQLRKALSTLIKLAYLPTTIIRDKDQCSYLKWFKT